MMRVQLSVEQKQERCGFANIREVGLFLSKRAVRKQGSGYIHPVSAPVSAMAPVSALALVLTMLAAFPVAATAQISLSSAVHLALKNDPKVKMSEASVMKAQAALQQTYDVYIPSIGADAGYGRGSGVPTGLPTVFTLSSQSLVFNFSQRDNIRAAASGLESAKLALHETRDQIAEDVAITYLNLDSDHKRQEAITQQYASATRLVAIVQARVEGGQDARTELLHARRTAKQIQIEQLHLEDEIANLSDHLSRLIGLPLNGLRGNQFITISSSIPTLPGAIDMAGETEPTDSFGLQASTAAAKSKQEYAFGVNRYLLRPQISLGLVYSRIDTSQNSYTDYYPGFRGKSENALGAFLSFQVPIYDRRHQDLAKEAAADASRARYETEDQRNQFQEGRARLRHSTAELAARSELAEIDRDLAQEQLDVILVQLSADAAIAGRPQLTPKDEQNARVQERQRSVELLDAQFQLNQAKVNLLRQTGQLEAWLKVAAEIPESVTVAPAKP